MKVVNSKQKQLGISEITMQVLANAYQDKKLPEGTTLQAAILAMVSEMSMPSTEVLQFGNTLYIVHYKEDDPSLIYFRALNLDTATHFVNTQAEFSEWPRRQGLNRMLSDRADPAINKLAELAFKRIPDAMENGNLKIVEANGKYRAYIKIGAA